VPRRNGRPSGEGPRVHRRERPGQYAAEGVEECVVLDRITVEPGKMRGQPCIRGLRFTVAHLLRLVAAGWDLDRIQDEFPFIEAEDVQQALLYAAESAEVTTVALRDTA
jgi:uncharacterized protein (DUF433 family)